MIRSDGRVEDHGLSWLGSEGPASEIVLSTRVRLARNLQGFPFSIRAGAEDRGRVLERVREAVATAEVLDGASMWELASLTSVERTMLQERNLISRELLANQDGEAPAGTAVVVSDDRFVGLMVNEEDHLRLQVLLGGFRPEDAWNLVDKLDEELAVRLPYAFHHEFGFLTSCPTNAGTGLRASVLIHLPGLVLTKEINRVLQGISQVGLTFRGLYGEGSEVVGNLFQISNQTTLGKSEEDLIEQLSRIVGKVIDFERDARGVLVREAPAVVEDKVWRAYGILRHARSLPVDEMINLLSGLRLGLMLKLLSTPRVETLNRIMVLAQVGHLEHEAGRSLDEIEADVCRATFVRDILSADEQSVSDASVNPILGSDDEDGGSTNGTNRTDA